MARRYPRMRSNTVTAVIVSRPNSARYASARSLTSGFPRLSSDRGSVSSTAGSWFIRSAFLFLDLAGEQLKFRGRNVRETGNCERENSRRRRCDVDVLSVWPAQQGNHL